MPFAETRPTCKACDSPAANGVHCPHHATLARRIAPRFAGVPKFAGVRTAAEIVGDEDPGYNPPGVAFHCVHCDVDVLDDDDLLAHANGECVFGADPWD